MRVDVTVVGGGISGLAIARWLEVDHGVDDVLVLEGSDRVGGKLYTEWDDGHCLEWGPQGFLDNSPDTPALAASVDLADEMVRTGDEGAARYIYRAGRLHEVKASPIGFLTSQVLPLSARLRVLLEPFGRRHPGGDETVASFASRRIGPGAARILVDAMVNGVFAGDPERLSLAATFPKMAAMEAEHGSLVRAMIARRRQRTAGAGPGGPGGVLTTFRRGMGQLSDALATALGERVRLSTPVRRIVPTDGGFELELDEGHLTTRRLVLSVPAHVAAELLAGPVPDAVAPLRGIETAPIAVVMTSHPEGAFPGPTHGFGFLVPGAEEPPILGTLYCHSIFPGQAPDGTLLMRTMIGGARDRSVLDGDDDELLARARRGMELALGADPEPTRSWIVRHPRGISQYDVGHLERVSRATGAAAEAGIELAGSSYLGVSVNDGVRTARATARRIAEALADPA